MIACFCAEALHAQKRRKNKKGEEEEITQTLELPKDPPNAVVADPQRLVFLTAPMSSKGLLSQQVRDGAKALRSLARGGQIVKIRGFVAGTGDLRRLAAVVSEYFTDSRQPIPAVSAIQVGALPQEGAQVWMEAIAVDKKAVNPNGLAFLSGQAVSGKEPVQRVMPLITESAGRLQTALKGINVPPDQMLRVTCFTSALGDYAEIRSHLAQQFPKATTTVVQLLRGLSNGLVECEGMARLVSAPSKPLDLVNPAGLQASANYSLVALVNAPKVVITGTQLAFNSSDADIRLAFDRLGKSVEEAGGSLKNTVMTGYYPLTQSTMDKIRQVRFEFLDKGKPPASTMLLFEGLPSMDASFGVEVIALP
ncbi:MAG: RidA family protein [Bryobacteraceae bacterium]|nr:RidA family protein [Bryobacteraceae bacterium]